MARMGSRVHLCKGCEERGIVTHVRKGQELCRACLAERAAELPGPGEEGYTADAARQVLEMRAAEMQMVQAGLYSIAGAAAGVFMVLRMTSPRHGPSYLKGEALWLALGLGAFVGGVLGWFFGWNRPQWKSGL
jgi:hypothetical protein